MKKWPVNMMSGLLALILILPSVMVEYAIAKNRHIPLELINLPPGFKITVFAADIPELMKVKRFLFNRNI